MLAHGFLEDTDVILQFGKIDYKRLKTFLFSLKSKDGYEEIGSEVEHFQVFPGMNMSHSAIVASVLMAILFLISLFSFVVTFIINV